MPKVIPSIEAFLTKRKETHNGPDLLERLLKQTQHMEMQVNVAAGKGFPIDGKRGTYGDGIDEWFNFRVPKNAASDPSFKDYELRWPLDEHAEAIGCTGWDWAHRRSRWVGFDFDSITGHAVGVGVTDAELERVKESAKALPWVEVRRSTGGGGLHLYVLFEDAGVPTSNHTEHAALGRAVLGLMASETGFDFDSQVDQCGGNMWIWARKMSPVNGGLSLLKAAERPLLTSELPTNWKDHIEVVTRKRTKIRIDGIEDDALDPFEALASSRRIVPLDDKHKRILDALRQSGYTATWVPDYHLLQTHTCAFAQLMEEQKDELGLQGFFKTISEGKDKGGANCFAFPVDDGGWKVYLFGRGRNEAETWEQDGQGWTTCGFNRAPNLKVASRAMGGIEDAEKGGFVFDTVEQAQLATEALGQKITVPAGMLQREVRLKAAKDGRLTVQIAMEKGDEGMKKHGWLPNKKGDLWSQIFEIKAESKTSELSGTDFDPHLRALKSPSGESAGWVRMDDKGEWVRCNKDDARSKLLSLGHPKTEADVILGLAGAKNWKIVNLPFKPEYPGDRQWNMNSPQYAYAPVVLSDDEVPYHPHWDMVLKHCGQDLDDALKSLDWARAANIKTGADYLLHWAACMMMEPEKKLPYLFFYGDQNNGKSTYHLALALLMTKGVAAADRALTNANDFNGELANAVLAYIEEKDIAKTAGAYNKLKDWVTSPTLWIRKMRTDAYSQVNTLHFVQCANEREALTIKQGDTRITIFFVPALDPGQEIPEEVLMDRLREEAPHFMRTLVDLQLPPVMGRLRLPVVNTENKSRAEESSRTSLEQFIAEQTFEVPGSMILFSEFFDRFHHWMAEEDIEDKDKWVAKIKVVKGLPHKYPYGIKHSNQRFIGNLSWENVKPEAGAQLLIVKNGKLKPKG